MKPFGQATAGGPAFEAKAVTDSILRSLGESCSKVPPRVYAGPGFDSTCLSADSLRSRAEACREPWWDATLGGLSLNGFDLRGHGFRAADLGGANLGGSDLSGVKGARACLRGAHLEQARFDKADLAGADFSGAAAGESSFRSAMLEDARFEGARLRFADLSSAVLEGASFDGADLWGCVLEGIDATNASFRRTELSEARMAAADLAGADMQDATLKQADLRKSRLVGADLRGARVDAANFDEADLSRSQLSLVSLSGCSLRNVRLAGAWLERTQMHVDQLGGAVGEEVAGDYPAAINAYGVLQRNFLSLGDANAATWAFLRQRRMGKLDAFRQMRAGWRERRFVSASHDALRWLSDVFVEWLCDYGESVPRVVRAFAFVIVAYAVFYGLTDSLVPTKGVMLPPLRHGVELLLYSVGSMTTVGTSFLGLRPAGTFAALVVATESFVGPILLGLFGFVLGNKLRR